MPCLSVCELNKKRDMPKCHNQRSHISCMRMSSVWVCHELVNQVALCEKQNYDGNDTFLLTWVDLKVCTGQNLYQDARVYQNSIEKMFLSAGHTQWLSQVYIKFAKRDQRPGCTIMESCKLDDLSIWNMVSNLFWLPGNCSFVLTLESQTPLQVKILLLK